MATITNTSTLADILHLDELEPAEQAGLLDQIGALVMEGATMKFLVDASEADQETFVTYIEAHEGDEDFLSNLIQTFPGFAEVMAGEMKALEADLRQILGE